MSLIERIEENFYRSIEIKNLAITLLPQAIATAGEIMAQCISSQHKILACGNGGSACDAQHFTTEMVNRFIIERPNLPAVSLTADTATITAIANDYDYTEVFARQIKALGNADDILLAISTSGRSKNIIAAIAAAHQKKMRIIALTGGDGGIVKTILQEDDIEIRVPSDIVPRIQEVHTLIIHSLCDLVDEQLFSKVEEKI